jgi:hypothetical protein
MGAGRDLASYGKPKEKSRSGGPCNEDHRMTTDDLPQRDEYVASLDFHDTNSPKIWSLVPSAVLNHVNVGETGSD